MGPTDTSSIYGLIGTILVALISGFVAIKVSKRSAAAGEDASRIERGVDSVEGWMRLTEGMGSRITSLETGQKESDGKIAQLSRDLEFMHTWKRAAIRYILELRKHSARHIMDEPLPLPPVELLHDLRDKEES